MTTTERRPRVPFGGHRTKMQLSVEDLKGFEERGEVPRWINNQDGRLQRALSGGYTFAEPEEAASIGQFGLNKGDKDLDGKVSMIVSKGSIDTIRAFLMKIPKEYYDADKVAKELRNQSVDEMLDRNKSGDPGGTGVENAYIPGGMTLTR